MISSLPSIGYTQRWPNAADWDDAVSILLHCGSIQLSVSACMQSIMDGRIMSSSRPTVSSCHANCQLPATSETVKRYWAVFVILLTGVNGHRHFSTRTKNYI